MAHQDPSQAPSTLAAADAKPLTHVDIGDALPKVASGKVRDLFEVDAETLLFVASDRVSCYDVVMGDGIPGKGAILTAMSIYWFRYLSTQIPSLRTHFLSTDLPPSLSSLPQKLRTSLQSRSMLVRRLEILPIESIVRGYITGSGWAEYQKSGTVNGISLPTGFIEGAKLPEPLWTPSTKAEQGGKDENISPARAREIIGDERIAAEVERLSLAIYDAASKRAEQAGIIIADTKFEFGLERTADGQAQVVLVDEVLTPDSSRFWPRATWEEHLGRAQPSFDKQYLRDWLVDQGLKGKEGVRVPEDVVRKTGEKYREVLGMLAGDQ